jgi:hypothetical protein
VLETTALRPAAGGDTFAAMLADVVKKVAKGPRAAPPSAATIAFLEKHRVPPKIVRTLQACSFANWLRVGHLTLYAFAELPKQNRKPNHYALRNGFLVMGNGLNGDPVAVELSNGKVAFLAHDVLWTFDPDCNAFEDCVARSKLDIDTFWTRALTNDDFPVDFYAAGGGGARAIE